MNRQLSNFVASRQLKQNNLLSTHGDIKSKKTSIGALSRDYNDQQRYRIKTSYGTRHSNIRKLKRELHSRERDQSANTQNYTSKQSITH